MRRSVFLGMLILASALGVQAQTNTINTVAGGGTNGVTAATAYLPAPYGIAKDKLGNTYLSVPFLYTVYKVTPAGAVSVYAGTGTLGFTGDNGPATSAQLGQPQGLAVDGSGNLYIAESQSNRIRKVDTSGIITTVAGSGNQYNGVGFFGGYSGDAGPATSALLNGPSGVAVDPNGNLFIADTNNNVIRMVDNSPEHIITTYAGGAATVCATATDAQGNGCPATQAVLAAPQGVAVHSSGDVYIADTGFFLVRKVDNTANHIITSYAGNIANTICATPPATDNVGDGCPATQAILSFPEGIFVDGTENVFIGDNGDQRVRRIDRVTQIITSVAGNGSLCLNPATPPPNCGDGGAATSALLNSPIGVIVDGVGDVIFADSGTGRYRMLTPGASPTISNLAGGGTGGDTLTATNGLLASPFYVVSDGSGNFFTSESFGFRVRRVDAATQAITTYAGNGIQGTAGNGGAATQANLLSPTSMALDGAGNLYFRDGLVVRKVDAATKTISVVAGNGARCNVNANPTCGNGGPATSAPLARPSAIALDPQGNLYIADVRLNQIRVVCLNATCPIPSSTLGDIYNFAGTGAAGFTNGPALSATMNFPFQMVFDGNGNMYFADSNNNVIRKIDNTAQHNVTTYAFNGQPTFGGDGGPALSASMQFPQAVALDPSGNLFVGGGLDNIVRRIDVNDHSVITVAGNINNLDGGFTGDGGLATKALLDNFGVAVAPGQNLLIADAGNNRIRKVHLAPVAVVTSLLQPFGPVLPGDVSNPGIVTITNNGLDDLTVTNASVPAGFTLTNSCISPALLPIPVSPVAGSCVLDVAFAPPVGTPNGTPFGGNLTFNTNDPAHPSFSFALNGTAVTTPETLTITLAGTGTGIVSGSPEGLVNGSPALVLCTNATPPPCPFNFAQGQQVTLFAIGNAGSALTGWTVNGLATTCPGTTPGCTVTMSAAQNVTANFGPASISVAGMGNGSGHVTSSPAGIDCTVTNGVASGPTCTFSNFPAGTQNVTLTATAAAGGLSFSGWLGLCGLIGSNGLNTAGTGPCTLPFSIAGVTALNGALATAVFSGPPKRLMQGDVFVGTVDGMIFEFNPSTPGGTLVQVLNSGNLGGTIAGMNFDTGGNLYAANPSAINTGPNPGTVEFFMNTGAGPSFDFGLFNSSPLGVLVAPSGDVFVGQSAGQNTLLQFSDAVHGLPPKNTFFPAYDNAGVGYLELLDDGASVLYSTETPGSSQLGTVKNFDILNNHQNPDFATGLTGGPAFAIRELPDKSVLVANTTQIVHLDQTGKPMGAPSPYKPGGGGLFYALNLDPSETSFWTGDAFSGKVYQVKISDGTILNTINTGLGFNSSALNFATIYGIAVFGQPQSGGADLAVTMTASPSPVAVSSPLTYKVTVTNNGPLPATGITLTDTFPVPVNTFSGQGSCKANGMVNGLTCTVIDLTSGSNATLNFSVTTPAAPATVVNTVNATSAVPDPIPGNNSFTTSTTVLGAQPAAITMAAPSTLELGASLTYQIQVANPGGTTLTSIAVTDTLPASLNATSLSPGCTGTNAITCTIASLTSGQIVNLNITIVPTVTAVLANTANVTGGNSATVNTTVITGGVPLILEVDSVNSADFITTNPSSGTCTTPQAICTSYFPPATAVTVTANGPGFVGWSVNNASSASCPPSSNTCSVTLNSPQQVLAAYNAIGLAPPQLTGVVGVPFGVDLSHGVIGGVAPYTITLTGTLPNGLTFTAPSIFGIPTATGVTPLTVNITDSIGEHGSTPVTLTIINPPTGQEALANGNYAIVFHLVSDTDGSLFAVAGSLHFNGKGLIDSGTLDTNGTGAGRGPQTVSVTGTYTIGADHRCLITLQNVGKTFATIACSVGDIYQGVAHTARIIEFDDNTPGGVRGAGVARLQDPKAFNAASFAGPYIFAGTGQDSVFARFIEEGLFTVTATGNFGSGSADANDNGVLATIASITGTYSEPGLAVPIDPGNGRTQWSLNGGTTSAASFIIDANNVVFITKDPVATSGVVIAGTAERQLNTAPFDATFLSGPDVIAAQSPSNAGKNSDVLIGVGTFTAAAGPNPMTGTLSFTKDENDSGNVTLEGIENDPYTMAANGRLVVTPANGKPVFGYLSRPNHGYLMGTDASPAFGTIDLQTGGPFTVPALPTGYFFGDREPASTTRGEDVSGVVTLSNNTASATFDQSHQGGRLDYAESATFGISLAPTGRLILTHNPSNLIAPNDEIGQVITPSHIVFSEFDPSQTHATLHEEQAFQMPAGLPLPNPASVTFPTPVASGSNAMMTLTFTNSSDGLLSFTGVDTSKSPDFKIDPSSTCVGAAAVVVLAHSTCTGVVTFAPQPGTPAGPVSENLTLQTDAGNVTITANGTVAGQATTTHFAVSAQGLVSAGTAFNFTVTAQDAANNTVTTFADTVNFSSSDGAAMLPASDVGLTNGVGNFQATLNTVGPQTITVTDANTAAIKGVSNTITVSAGAPQTANVHLIDNGSGAVGTVVDNSVPQQINCTDATGQLPGPACSTTYPDGTTVTFTATPGAGAAFVNWNGSNVTCKAGTPANVCTVTVTGFTSVEANFTNGPGGPFTLTVAPPAGATGGGRISSGVTGGALNCTFTGATTSGACTTIPLKSGTVTEAIPVPDPNSTFGGYAGSCPTQVVNNCFVPMSQNQTVKPVFNIIPITLKVAFVGNGTITSDVGGINCSNPAVAGNVCQTTVNSGTTVTLTETPGIGYSFAGLNAWSPSSCGINSTPTTCVLSLTAGTVPSGTLTMTATFTINTYLLNASTVGGNGSGTVTSNVVNGQGGSINCGPNNQPPASCAVFATFNAPVTLTAAPQAGSTFTSWAASGVAGFVLPCAANPVCNFNMPVTPAGGLTVTATFTKAAQQFTLTVTDAGTGSGTVKSQQGLIPGISCTTGTADGCSGTYNSGTPVTLTAAAAAGSTFIGWSGGTPACSGNATCSVTMTQAQNVTATFNLNGPALVSIAVTPATVTLAVNSTQQFTATGTFSDNSHQNLTNSVAWASSDGTVVTINSAPAANPGLATVLKAGEVIVSATQNGISSNASGTSALLATPFTGAFQPGQLFVSDSFGLVEVFKLDGTFLGVLNTQDTQNAGMAFDRTGNLYVTTFDAGGVVKFGPTGAFLGRFGSGYTGNPESILFSQAGNAFVGAAQPPPANCPPPPASPPAVPVFEFDATGTPVKTFQVVSECRGSDWVELLKDQKTLLYTSEGKLIKSFDVSTSTQNPDFASGLPGSNAFELRQLPDGDILIADSNAALLLNGATGAIKTTYTPTGNPISIFALNLDPDGTSFWTADLNTGTVYKFDIASGTQLLTFTSQSGAASGLAIFGEKAPGQNNINILGAGNGAGIVTSNPAGLNCGLGGAAGSICTAPFTDNTNVVLTATASAGSTFGSFSDNCTRANPQTNPPTCVVALGIADIPVTVTFNAAAPPATHFLVTAPASATVATSFNFTVTAQDASNNTVTTYNGTVRFTSSDGAVALPADSTLTNGVGTFSATLNTAGSQTITATDKVTASITGSATVTVIKLVSIAVTPANPTVVVGQQQQFTATGTFSDNSQKDLTSSVTWTSMNGNVASIVNTPGVAGTGNATALSAGSTTITATDPPNVQVSGSTTLTVTNVPFLLTITPPPGGNPGAPLTVSPGGSLAIGLNLAAAPGFSGTVKLSCVSDKPQFLTCAPAPSSVTLTGNGPKQVAIVLNAFCSGVPTQVPGPGGIGGGLQLLVMAMMFGSIALAYRKRSRLALSFAVLMFIALGSAACSSVPTGPNGRTPAGPYKLFITASAGGSTQTVELPITVTP